MANTTLSPNMSLIIPTVSVDPGPDWANNINSSLGILDQHNHSPGSGVQITPSGLNINSALSMGGQSLTNTQSVQFQPQASFTTVDSVYVSGVDLFYNDGNGNSVRITQSGSVAGSSGTITGLPSGTASASYQSVSGTFQFQSATNTPANISGASYIFAQQTTSPNTITVQSPDSLASSYSLTWPVGTPAVSSVVLMDTSGNLSTTPSVYLVPVGVMLDYTGSSAPTGFLLCDGSSYSTTTYAALFAVTGYTFGGSGSSFNVPNMQRRVAMGSGGSGTGTIGNTIGSTGGEENHTLVLGETPTHTHLIVANAAINQQPISGSTAISIDQGGSIGTGGTGQIGGTNTTAGLGISSSVGSGGSHNTIQPSLIVTKIIKF